jgi:hypothetical protein
MKARDDERRKAREVELAKEKEEAEKARLAGEEKARGIREMLEKAKIEAEGGSGVATGGARGGRGGGFIRGGARGGPGGGARGGARNTNAPSNTNNANGHVRSPRSPILSTDNDGFEQVSRGSRNNNNNNSSQAQAQGKESEKEKQQREKKESTTRSGFSFAAAAGAIGLGGLVDAVVGSGEDAKDKHVEKEVATDGQVEEVTNGVKEIEV